MKKKVLGLLLLVIFGVTVLISGCSGVYHFEKYDDANVYQTGNFTYQKASINKVEIDWVEGSVEIVQSEKETLSVTEEQPAKNEKDKLHYYIERTTLKIKYCQSGKWGKIDADYKKLRVEIPPSIDLEVESVNADITLNEMQLLDCSLESVSGSIKVNGLTAREADVETTSGDVYLVCNSAVDVNVEVVSGKVELQTQYAVTGEIETTSGEVRLKIANDVGLKLTVESISGDLQTEKSYQQNGRSYTFGAGGSRIDVQTTSGDIIVE